MNQINSMKYRILIVLLVSIVPLHAFCADYFTVNGINYQVISSSENTARVGWHTTNGTSTSYQNTPTALSNTNMTGSIEIPSVAGGYTIIEIDTYAFSNSKLSEIVIPNTIKTIKGHSFNNCPNLKNFVIPSSVQEIGSYAFKDCPMLEEIEIPSSITTLELGVFNNCTNLKRVKLSENLITINSSAFSACSNLKTISFPNTVETINEAFAGSGILQVEIPSSAVSLSLSFQNCKSLLSAVIDENVNYRNMNTAFRYCSNLKHIYSKSHLESFYSYSENFTGIAPDSHLYVPTGTKSKYVSTTGWKSAPNIAEVLGDVLFILSNNNEVTEYMVTNKGKREVQIGTNSFVAIPNEKTTYEIPSKVTNTNGEVFNVVGIGNNAFVGCANLESLRIPQSILKISSAFNGCVKLRSIYFDSRNPSDIEFESNCFDELPSDAYFYVPAGTKSKYEALGVIKNPSHLVEVSPISIGDVTVGVGSQTNLPIILNNKEVISGLQYKLTIPEGVSLVEENGEPIALLTNRTEGFTVMGRKDPDAPNSYLFLLFSMDGNPISGNEGAVMNVRISVDPNVEMGKYETLIEDVSLATATFETRRPVSSVSELTIDDSFDPTNPRAFIPFKDEKVKAICIANWDTNGDKKLTISEASAVTDLGWDAFGDNEEITSFDELQYFTGLTSIGEYAFGSCSALKSIKIPNSVTSFEEQAFTGCLSLTSIEIPNSVTSIGNGVFSGCSALTSIVIPNSVTSIGESAFYECTALTSIEIPNSVTYLGEWAFSFCSALTSIEIPNSVTSIGEVTFQCCSALTSVKIPNSVTSIGEDAFSGCSALTSIEIPNSVTSIGIGAFNYCPNLSFVIVKWNQPISITKDVFSNRANATLTVPSGCRSLYESADYWKEFKKIVDGTVIIVDGFKYLIISAEEKTAKVVGGPSEGDIVIPSSFVYNDETYSVQAIDDSAFSECGEISSISIPNGITSIGKYAFYDCTGLTSLEIPNSVTSIGEGAFSGCSALTSIEIPNSVTSIGDDAFSFCHSLEMVIVPDIASWCSASFGNEDSNPLYHANCLFADEDTEITDLIIPSETTTINKWAFLKCLSLNAVTIPSSVTSLGDNAFDGCNNLTSVTVNWEQPISISEYVFTNRANATLTVPFGTKSLYETANYWKEFKEIVEGTIKTNDGFEYLIISAEEKTAKVVGGPSEGDIVIPSSFVYNDETYSVKAIDDNTFNDCGDISSIFIPNGITSIGEYAFYNCTGLTSLEIPNSVTSIGESAFGKCKLETVKFGNGLASIGNDAFSFCRYLEKVIVPDIASWCSVSFGNENSNPLYHANCLYSDEDTEITNLIIPSGTTTINKWAFLKCLSLNAVTIPSSITSMDENVFQDCNNLKVVKLKNATPIVISSDLFSNRSKATLYVPRGSLNDYTTANYWNEFKAIKEYPDGDVNQDGETDVVDVVDIAQYVVRKPRDVFDENLADLNCDDYVNVADAVVLVNEIAGDTNWSQAMKRSQNKYDDLLSLTENAAHLGLPVPEKLKEVLEQLHDRHDEEEK